MPNGEIIHQCYICKKWKIESLMDYRRIEIGGRGTVAEKWVCRKCIREAEKEESETEKDCQQCFICKKWKGENLMELRLIDNGRSIVTKKWVCRRCVEKAEKED